MSLYERTGRMSEILENEPDIPLPTEHILNWFYDLSSSRANSGYGPLPLSYHDIAAWSALMLSAPTPWEVGLLRRLDNLWLSVWSDGQKKDKPNGRSRTTQGRNKR